MSDIGDSSYQPPRTHTPRSVDYGTANDSTARYHMPQPRGSLPTSSRNSLYRQPLGEVVSSAYQQNHMDPNTPMSQQVLDQIVSEVVQRMQNQNISSPTMSNARPVEDLSPRTMTPAATQSQRTMSPEPYKAAVEAAQTRHSVADRYATGQQAYGRGTPPPGANETDQSTQTQSRRPLGPRRLSSSAEDTTIFEKAWKTLFTEEGLPTQRLGQFLRGVAAHLIEDYEPHHSLVITPEKLQRFYQETQVDNEIYPWDVIFDDETSNLSRLYREINAQHHLVQRAVHERPDTPGLTPQGFETYATLIIQAHPDLEFERFAKAVQRMPINNPDDTAERFPKELSRRLFPREPDPEGIKKWQRLIKKHCDVDCDQQSPSNATFSDPEAKSPQPFYRNIETIDGRPSKMRFSRPERLERNSRYQATVEDASPGSSRPTSFSTDAGLDSQQDARSPLEPAVEDDQDDVPTPQQEGPAIERPRNPYTAVPGGGREYCGERPLTEAVQLPQQPNVLEPRAQPDPRSQPDPQITSESRLTRSNSLAQNGRSPSNVLSQPAVNQRAPHPQVITIPENSGRRRRSHSMYYFDHPPSTRGSLRSPPISQSNDYTHRSDNDLRYAPHPNVASSNAGSSRDYDRRYHDFEKRRQRYPADRYDPARMSAYDPRERDRDRDRDRERDQRQRLQSTAGYEGGRPVYLQDEGYHPTTMAGSLPTPAYAGQHAYAPSAYREPRKQ